MKSRTRVGNCHVRTARQLHHNRGLEEWASRIRDTARAVGAQTIWGFDFCKIGSIKRPNNLVLRMLFTFRASLLAFFIHND